MAGPKITSAADVKKLQDDVARLQKLLDEKDVALAAAESAAAHSAAQQLASMGSNVMEIPTGKTVTVQRAKKYKTVGYKDDGRPIKEPIFEDVALPTFHYRIDLPPSGGVAISINGTEYYHNETYVVDVDLLRDLKDKVARAWGHEANIKGSNENIFRRPLNVTLRGGQRASR
jgi:hypothetical protein